MVKIQHLLIVLKLKIVSIFSTLHSIAKTHAADNGRKVPRLFRATTSKEKTVSPIRIQPFSSRPHTTTGPRMTEEINTRFHHVVTMFFNIHSSSGVRPTLLATRINGIPTTAKNNERQNLWILSYLSKHEEHGFA